MEILIFTEGTILMHSLAENVSREERVKQSKSAWMLRLLRNIAFYLNISSTKIIKGTVYDFENYIPIGKAVEKIGQWKRQGREIVYLTSRRLKTEIEMVKKVLQKYNFPDYENLLIRQAGESYQDVAEKLMPDVIIEDDCESIGGAREMVYPNINPLKKKLIKSIVVKEFLGIDSLPSNLDELKL